MGGGRGCTETQAPTTAAEASLEDPPSYALDDDEVDDVEILNASAVKSLQKMVKKVAAKEADWRLRYFSR